MPQSPADAALIAALRVFYQPVVRLADLRPDYVEVLSRSEAIDGTLTGPESIVAAMTESERSMRLTSGIMARAFGEYHRFGFAADDLRLAFNLPLDAMLHPDLVVKIEAARQAHNLPARNIRFELTERHPVHDLAPVRAVITALLGAGYGLALDDVTPDMPNLAALMDMPIRAIKLDRSVVQASGEAAEGFIQLMVAQATRNGQSVIAEGIETVARRDAMRALGVTHGQGYLFARPVSARGLQAFLRNRH